MKVVVVKCDEEGNVDIEDLKAKTDTHRDNLAAIMVTYPSTHGVFEESIAELCDIVHDAGGQVYVDGANLNALVGYCAPPQFGADVSHLNLHKTFCIPHGGGGRVLAPLVSRNIWHRFCQDHPLAAKARSALLRLDRLVFCPSPMPTSG